MEHIDTAWILLIFLISMFIVVRLLRGKPKDIESRVVSAEIVGQLAQEAETRSKEKQSTIESAVEIRISTDESDGLSTFQIGIPPEHNEVDRSVSPSSSSTNSKISIIGPMSGSKWIEPGEPIEIGDKVILGGNFYLGTSLESLDGYYEESSLIIPRVGIDDDHFLNGNHYFTDDTLGYWPSYRDLSKKGKSAYLLWLASDRSDPKVPIGYLFIYFYGIERRVLVDSKHGKVSDKEYLSLHQEVSRLLEIYSSNHWCPNVEEVKLT